MKYCNTCKRELADSKFSRVSGTNRLRSRCKSCTNQKAKEYRMQKAQGIFQPTMQITKQIKNPQEERHTCKSCGNTKALTEFHKRRSGVRKACWSNTCKQCDAQKQRELRSSGYRRPSQSDLASRLLSIKHRTSKNGKLSKKYGKQLAINLDVNSIRRIIGSQTVCGKLFCAISGVELLDRPKHPLRPSIDRIDPNQGYVHDNIRITSLMCNLAKRDLSDREFTEQLINHTETTIDQDNIYLLARKLLSRKRRSNIRNRQIDITENEIYQMMINNQMKCMATGLPLFPDLNHLRSPSLDRLNNNSDYMPGNVQIVCKAFNLGRNIHSLELSKESWLKILDNLKKRNMDLFHDELRSQPCFRSLVQRVNKLKYHRVRPQQCEIRLITNREARPFYATYHYIGPCDSKYNIGVYYQEQLLACLSLRKPSRQNAGDWEISRMARNPDNQIHGIWSYLMKWIRDRKLISGMLITYSDNRIFTGNVYKHMGFEHISDVAPNYYWVKDGKRYHKSNMRKTEEERQSGLTEHQLRTAQGYQKVFDNGKKKWSILIQ